MVPNFFENQKKLNSKAKMDETTKSLSQTKRNEVRVSRSTSFIVTSSLVWTFLPFLFKFSGIFDIFQGTVSLLPE